MNTLSCIHTTPAMEGGRMRKVKTIKTCDEVKRERLREKQMKRQQARREAMLQAVERVVILPEPLPKPIAKEEVVETPSQPMPQYDEGQAKRKPMSARLESIFSLIDRMKTFVLEEGD